jgi:hypothetical protein
MQRSAYYTQRINAERLNNNQLCVTRPPEYGVIAGKRSPCQTLMKGLLLVLLETEEAATVLVHDLECTTNSQ